MAKTKPSIPSVQPAPVIVPPPNTGANSPDAEDLLEGSASGVPATRADRLAFSLWLVMFLLLIGFTLISYLLNRIVRD